MTFLQSLGTALVGVFFPFLVAKAFGLEIWEIFIWLTSLNFAGFLIVYPLNKWLNRYLKLPQILQLGLTGIALFYLLLSISRNFPWLIILATVFLTLGIYTFWPNFHLFNLHSTKESARADHVGNMQVFTVGASIVAPLISGFLLQNDLEIWISLVAGISFGSAIFFAGKLAVPKLKLSNWNNLWDFFSRDFIKSPMGKFCFIEGIQSGTLLTVWPVFFKSVLASFIQMGSFISFSAVVEMISAKISGKLIDQKSAKKTLQYSAIIRFFDLGIRGLLVFWPTAMMAGIASFFAGFLGPVFNISYYTRLIELAEKNPEHEWNFFIVREWILSGMRGLTYFFAGISVLYFGIKSLVVFLFIAALASFGLRKS